VKSQLEEGALHLVEEGLLQFFSEGFERNIFKQFNEPSPGDRVILGWILEPVVEYLVATHQDHDWSVSPTSLAWLQEYKDFPNSVPFVTNVLDYSQPMCFTSFFPLDQHKVSSSRLLIYNMNNNAI